MSTPKNPDWSSFQYLLFNRERTRAVSDLVSHLHPLITSPSPRIFDLGCGPGNSTRVLLSTFPSARITGMDSSPDMLVKANAEFAGEEQQVNFVKGELERFEIDGGEGVDLVFSNAVFHWLRSRTRIPTLLRLFTSLQPGGVVAIQVPDNYHEPSHRLMRETASMSGQAWSEDFKDTKIGDLEESGRPDLDPIESAVEWYNALIPYASHVNIWRTTYQHVLKDAGAIVEWVKGTGLQPYLHRITSSSAKEAFLSEYEKKLKDAYPELSDGSVLLAYPRLFVVAVRK